MSIQTCTHMGPQETADPRARCAESDNVCIAQTCTHRPGKTWKVPSKGNSTGAICLWQYRLLCTHRLPSYMRHGMKGFSPHSRNGGHGEHHGEGSGDSLRPPTDALPPGRPLTGPHLPRLSGDFSGLSSSTAPGACPQLSSCVSPERTDEQVGAVPLKNQ